MTGRKPLIGIWWDNGRKTIALSHEVDINSSGGDLVDSDLSHSESWLKICHAFGMTDDDEYFIVPRGRVLYQSIDGRGLIYHGRGTSQRRLKAVAKVFRLTSWISRLDDHYAVGRDAYRIFEDS